MSRVRILGRLAFVGVVLFAGMVVAAPPEEQQKQIEAIQKQIADLKQKLAELLGE